MSAASILRWGVANKIIPNEAEVTSKGTARWCAGDLEVLAWLGRTPTQSLTWYANVGDCKYGEAMAKYGRMSVPVRSLENQAMDWPVRETAEVTSFLQEG